MEITELKVPYKRPKVRDTLKLALLTLLARHLSEVSEIKAVRSQEVLPNLESAVTKLEPKFAPRKETKAAPVIASFVHLMRHSSAMVVENPAVMLPVCCPEVKLVRLVPISLLDQAVSIQVSEIQTDLSQSEKCCLPLSDVPRAPNLPPYIVI